MDENQNPNEGESKKGLNPMLIVGGLVVVVVLGGGFLLMKGSRSTQDTNSNPSSNTETVEEAGVVDSQANIINVEGGSFYYKPNEIRVKKGQTVKIVLASKDMMHDFVIDELNVRTQVIRSGQTGEVEFTPATVGEFEFYCSVGNHRAQGMVGTLIVEE